MNNSQEGVPVSKAGICGSLQFRVLRLGLLQHGDVGVGVFPEGEEVAQVRQVITFGWDGLGQAGKRGINN